MMRGPASISTMRAAVGSMRRKSIARLWRATSEMAPAISTPVAPPPTIEGEEVLALGRVGGKLRALEGDEDAPPDAGGVLDALEARRHLSPFVVAEIRMGRAGGEHEVVVGDAHRIDLHEPLAGINGA